MRVVAATGTAIADALVRAEGASSRQGSTSSEGVVVLTSLGPGTYRCRIEREGFITLEKEVTIRAGARASVEAVLTPAPPPPPPPPTPTPTPTATPTPTPPPLVAGDPKVIGLAELADQLLKETGPVVERPLGCSGATASRLIRANEDIASHTHADADEILYVLATRATLRIDGKDQNVEAGWFGLVPRGTAHSIVRRERKPLVMLSILSGPPCPPR
jgi:hypothetical protein